jgi:elongation factor P
MLGINELRANTKILINGEPYTIVNFQHSKMGRGGAVVRTTMKHLVTGNMLNKTFQGADKIEEANITTTRAQFLYREGENLVFMDNETYEQFEFTVDAIGEDRVNMMPEGLEIDVLRFNENPVNISLPGSVVMEIKESEIGAKGNTASGNVQKKSVTDTGYELMVPQFIVVGDKVRVNTDTGLYIERV